MKWPWWLHWRNPGFDRRGRIRFLLGREPDPTQCVPPGIAPDVAERALTLIRDAFVIPREQWHCLRPHDELLALHNSVTPPGWPDNMEFETLNWLLQKALGRQLDKAIWARIKTVEDVVRLVASGQGV